MMTGTGRIMLVAASTFLPNAARIGVWWACSPLLIFRGVACLWFVTKAKLPDSTSSVPSLTGTGGTLTGGADVRGMQ